MQDEEALCNLCAKYKVAQVLSVEDIRFSDANMVRFPVMGLPYLTKEVALCAGCCKDVQMLRCILASSTKRAEKTLPIVESLWPTPLCTVACGNDFSAHLDSEVYKRAIADTMKAMIQPSTFVIETCTLRARGTQTDAELLCQLVHLQAEAHVSPRAVRLHMSCFVVVSRHAIFQKSTPIPALCGFCEAYF